MYKVVIVLIYTFLTVLNAEFSGFSESDDEDLHSIETITCKKNTDCLTGGGWAYCDNDSCKCMTGRIFDTIVNSCECSLDARNQEQSGCRKKIAGIDELEPCERLNCGENGKCVGTGA